MEAPTHQVKWWLMAQVRVQQAVGLMIGAEDASCNARNTQQVEARPFSHRCSKTNTWAWGPAYFNSVNAGPKGSKEVKVKVQHVGQGTVRAHAYLEPELHAMSKGWQ